MWAEKTDLTFEETLSLWGYIREERRKYPVLWASEHYADLVAAHDTLRNMLNEHIKETPDATP